MIKRVTGCEFNELTTDFEKYQQKLNFMMTIHLNIVLPVFFMKNVTVEFIIKIKIL